MEATVTILNETPRARAERRGVSSLTDNECLAVALGCDVNSARSLMQYAGGTFRKLFTADKSVTKGRYARLAAIVEVQRRFLAEAVVGRVAIRDPASVRRLLQARMRDLPHEEFVTLFLDNQHRIIAIETLSTGTIDGASVYPREVIKAALKHNAAAVLFAHNHPSGIPEPSAADRTLTERLKAALAQVDIRVLDHFVVGEQVISFAERGWL